MKKQRKTFLSIFEIIAFLADITALGQLAFDVISKNDVRLGNFIFRVFIIAFAFLLAFMIHSERIKVDDSVNNNHILKVYLWAYLAIANFSYIAIIFKISSNYSFGQFLSIVIILGVQLLAFTMLMKINKTENTAQYAYLMLATSLIHLLKFIFNSVLGTESLALAWDIILEIVIWVGWSFYSLYLLSNSKTQKDSNKGIFSLKGR